MDHIIREGGPGSYTIYAATCWAKTKLNQAAVGPCIGTPIDWEPLTRIIILCKLFEGFQIATVLK